MKYRIKAYHHKDYSRYIPQWRFLCFWNNFDDKVFGYIDFGSRIKAQKFLNDYIDKCNPKIEYIPYEEIRINK